MKTKIVKLSDIAKHPRLSLSPRDYIDDEKYCSRCKTWQPLPDNFHKRGDGYHSYCKRCVSERAYELRHGAKRKIKRRTRAELEKARNE